MESREAGSMQWGTDGKNYYLLGASEKLYIEGAKDLIVIKKSATTQRSRIAEPSTAPLSNVA